MENAVVWKFPVKTNEKESKQDVAMPEGARILSIRRSQIFALVDPSAPSVIRKFHIYQTGQAVDPMAYTGEWNYIGSYSNFHGYHVFEEV